VTERLDDLAALAANDPSGMLEAVLGLAAQCREGYGAGLGASDLPSGDGVTAVAICGMGGSGVSGDVIRALYRDRLTLPVTVAKGPALPAFCGKDTLVVVSSYSGRTAETLACFDQAGDWGCRLVAVTSGGELGRRAAEQAVAVVPVPPGFQPRAAVGHLTFGALGALEAMGVIPTLGDEVDHVAGVLERLRNRIGPEIPVAENPAKRLAVAIGDRFPVVWGADGIGSVAAGRWRTELNENAKVPAFSAALPELDHNEVVGWSAGSGDRFVLLTLRHGGEHPDVAARFPVSVEVALTAGLPHHEVEADGDTPLSSLMSLVMLGGAVSVYLAALRGVDPTPIEAITRIKKSLEG
jgi:glucose/mannose-6-phosphate isomerase